MRHMNGIYKYEDGKLYFRNVIYNRWVGGLKLSDDIIKFLTTKRDIINRRVHYNGYFLTFHEFKAINRWLLGWTDNLVLPEFDPNGDIEVVGKIRGLPYKDDKE